MSLYTKQKETHRQKINMITKAEGDGGEIKRLRIIYTLL